MGSDIVSRRQTPGDRMTGLRPRTLNVCPILDRILTLKCASRVRLPALPARGVFSHDFLLLSLTAFCLRALPAASLSLCHFVVSSRLEAPPSLSLPCSGRQGGAPGGSDLSSPFLPAYPSTRACACLAQARPPRRPPTDTRALGRC